MKRTILLSFTMLLIAVSSFATEDISEKVLESFGKTFENATNVTWVENANIATASFKVANTTVIASFDEDGNLLETIKNYGAAQLPSIVLNKLVKKFKGYWFHGITENATPHEILYHVILKNNKNWIILDIDEFGTIIEKQVLRKL